MNRSFPYSFAKKSYAVWLLSALSVIILTGCGRPSAPERKQKRNEFTNEIVLKTTPVQDQGRSNLCWIYAMLATIETKCLMQGDSVHLSTDYPARMLLRDEARRYFLSHHRRPMSTRGMSSMALRLLEQYGILAYDAYHRYDGVNYDVLGRKAEQIAKACASLGQLDGRLDRLFDEEIGYMPKVVFMLGFEYTPVQFAQSVCRPGEYLQLTSFSHHPFGESFALETPDNRMHDTFLNVPLDTIMQRVDHALRGGYPVCWEGDISEPGFSFADGKAVLQDEDAAVDQSRRQRDFERLATTDDHCMMLCGIARDRQGRKFYLAKNSWGTNNPYGGFMYLSENYVKMKTIAIFVSQDAFVSK